MVLGKDDTGVGMRREVVVLVRKDRNDEGIGTVLVEVFRQRAPSRTVELMAKQQGPAAAHADFEQGGYDRLHAKDLAADRLKRPAARLPQGGIG